MDGPANDVLTFDFQERASAHTVVSITEPGLNVSALVPNTQRFLQALRILMVLCARENDNNDDDDDDEVNSISLIDERLPF